jgi:transposase InsO family protein
MRRRSESVARRNQQLLNRIRDIKADHPFWGYRRMWAYLRYRDGLLINKKRVYRLMREHNLTVKRNQRPKAERSGNRPKPVAGCPNQWWGIDMTKVMTDSGWIYIVIVLDWYSKKVVGHYAGIQAKSCHWLEALDRAVNRQFPDGVRDRNLHLMSDNGSQPTSVSFMKACSNLDIHQAFTSYNNPKGNADTERMMRTLKEELLWLREWPGADQIRRALDKWIEEYNQFYLHSALDYKTPNQVEKTWIISHATLLKSA